MNMKIFKKFRCKAKGINYMESIAKQKSGYL